MSTKPSVKETSAKHKPNPVPATPSPWRAEAITAEAHADPDLHIDNDEVFWIVGGPAEEVLALVEERPLDHAEAEANARLIAAAPELLEACELFTAAAHETVALLNGKGFASPSSIAFAAEKARNAIEKAVRP